MTLTVALPPTPPPPRPDPEPHPSQGAIRACAKGGAHDMVQLLWGRLRDATVYGEQPLLPTAVTFTVLMRALSEQPDRRKQARDVLAVYDEAGRLARRLEYPLVNENTFKHALRACDLLGEP